MAEAGRLLPFAARLAWPVAWPVAAFAASALMLGAAHAFERFGGYAPCPLCHRQRELYWAALGLASLTLAGYAALSRAPARQRLRQAGCALLGLLFLVGAVVAGYHAGVEWGFWPGPGACAGGGGLEDLTGAAVLDALDKREVVVACDEAAWRLLGVSMAGYNALISAALAGLSFAAAMTPRPAGEDHAREDRD